VGTQTAQTVLDERLINRFDYDGDYGTVLNRFFNAGAVGTAHCARHWGQTRAFNQHPGHRSLHRACDLEPPASGERVQILNQMTESHRVRDLANLIAELTGAEIDYVDNHATKTLRRLVRGEPTVAQSRLKPITLAGAFCVRSLRSRTSSPIDVTLTRSRAARCGDGRGNDAQESLTEHAEVMSACWMHGRKPKTLVRGPRHWCARAEVRMGIGAIRHTSDGT